MKCISLIQVVFIWLIVAIAVALFVPAELTLVKNNASWIVGILLIGAWAYGRLTC